jgi:hypothetical protein
VAYPRARGTRQIEETAHGLFVGMRDVILALKRLSAMRERAEAISAEFDLDSKPGAGTRV